jgi:hypothetical protein
MGRQPATLRHWPLRAPKCPAHMNKAVCCLPASENPGKVAIEFRLLRACLASSCLDVFSTLPFFLELFPTSLCGVLVFRLAPAAPLPRPPAAVHLTHHTSLIKALLITPHSSHLTHHRKTHHTSLIIHHTSLITALLIATPHSSTSHTSLITSLIASSSSHLTPHLITVGTRSTQSFLEELRRAWPPLARDCLLRGKRSTQSLLAELRARGRAPSSQATLCRSCFGGRLDAPSPAWSSLSSRAWSDGESG